MVTPKFILSISIDDLSGLHISLLWRNYWYMWQWRQPLKVSRFKDQLNTEDFEAGNV